MKCIPLMINNFTFNTTKQSMNINISIVISYLYAGPSVEHFCHKYRMINIGIFLVFQSKTLLQKMDCENKSANYLIIL